MIEAIFSKTFTISILIAGVLAGIFLLLVLTGSYEKVDNVMQWAAWILVALGAIGLTGMVASYAIKNESGGLPATIMILVAFAIGGAFGFWLLELSPIAAVAVGGVFGVCLAGWVIMPLLGIVVNLFEEWRLNR